MTKLLDHAKSHFFLESRVPGSSTRITQRAHLEQLAKSGLKRDGRLDSKPPESLRYLWDWWNEDLAWSSPLSWSEIKAWSEASRRFVTAFEASVLHTIDKHFRNSLIEDNG